MRGSPPELEFLNPPLPPRFGTHSSEKTFAVLVDAWYRWWPKRAAQQGDGSRKHFFFTNAMYGRNVVSSQVLEVPALGVGTALRLNRGAWVIVFLEGKQQMSYDQ